MDPSIIDWQAVWITLKLAATTVTVLLLIGTPVAWWLAHTPSRARVWVEAVVALPLVLPPTVLGFYLLIGLGANGVRQPRVHGAKNVGIIDGGET